MIHPCFDHSDHRDRQRPPNVLALSRGVRVIFRSAITVTRRSSVCSGFLGHFQRARSPIAQHGSEWFLDAFATIMPNVP
jgi:hypothetical protein